MKFCIFGNGGHARDVAALLVMQGSPVAAFFDVKEAEPWQGIPVLAESRFDPAQYYAIIAVGEPALRRRIAERLPSGTRFERIIHRTATVGPGVQIGEGSVVFPNCVLTCGITIKRFAVLNNAVTVSHDVYVGEFFTAAPGVHLNGRVRIGDGVYMGSNASTVDGVEIASGTIVGAGACVAESLREPGTYVGVPARRLP